MKVSLNFDSNDFLDVYNAYTFLQKLKNECVKKQEDAKLYKKQISSIGLGQPLPKVKEL